MTCERESTPTACDWHADWPVAQAVQLRQPSFAGQIGIARGDITPPIGVYARNWGAAEHDVAASVHRPLTLTVLTFQREDADTPLVLISADAGWWRSLPRFQRFHRSVLDQLQLPAQCLMFTVTHTHSAVPLADSDATLPGGELLGDYLQQLLETTVATVSAALSAAQPMRLEWHIGHCALAAVRDLPDPVDPGQRILCGFNPARRADTTLLVGRITNEQGAVRAIVANYACHPTTLAWENQAISPDFVGAARDLVEQACGGAPLVFLQGASGDLAPRYQYVGDTRVADRHGRQLGFAVLQTLQDMAPPETELRFQRAVESGAPLAVWRYVPRAPSQTLHARQESVPLPLKNWPTTAELEEQQAASTDRVIQERLRRKLNVRRALGDGDAFPLPFWVWQLGEVLLVGSMAEAYSHLQQELRQRHANRLIVCLNLVNGSIGYLPEAGQYDHDVYQVWQTPFARGSLELMIQAMSEACDAVSNSSE